MSTTSTQVDRCQEISHNFADSLVSTDYPFEAAVEEMAPSKKSAAAVSSSNEINPFELPRLRTSFGFEMDMRNPAQGDTVSEFFDVKFFPDQPLDQGSVFAAISKKHIIICKLSTNPKDENNLCEIISIIKDDDDGALNCSCSWSHDPATGDPLLCVAGKDAKVKVYNVVKGKVACCLTGHGGEINDLATSPADPTIIASASDDTTVRIWSLASMHRKQPCLCLFGGEEHTAGLLSVTFHSSGRYILSAGHDGVINLWTLPELPTDPVARPIQILYSHFSSSEIHSSLVDCVLFYGDDILSRACHDEVIVLWRIEGFSSKNPPPPQSMAPSTYDPSRLTRSAFSPSQSADGPILYTRILELETPGCGPQFFMRFKLHYVPDQNQVLAFCNSTGKIFFWDFDRILAYEDFVSTITAAEDSKPVAGSTRPSWLLPIYRRGVAGNHSTSNAGPVRKVRETSDRDSTTSVPAHAVPPQRDPARFALLSREFNPETIASWENKYSTNSPHGALKAHKVESCGASTFVGRQVAWSPGGEWCVVVGSSNFALILQRWGKK